MTRRRLPIGIQTFREVREDDCYYVDKTAFVRRLLDEGKHFFLSRPRRNLSTTLRHRWLEITEQAVVSQPRPAG